MGRLGNIFNSVLLLEGRVENARNRYPQFSDLIFNYYVDNDPSGNQKYLDWMLGATVDASKSFGSPGKNTPVVRGG